MPTVPLTRAPRAGALDREHQRRGDRAQVLQRIRDRAEHRPPPRRRRASHRRAGLAPELGTAYTIDGRVLGQVTGIEWRAQTVEVTAQIRVAAERATDELVRLIDVFRSFNRATRRTRSGSMRLRPAVHVQPYRDEHGRFARAPAWWRPRDASGRFVPSAQVAQRALPRDAFGRFLPTDRGLAQHILDAQRELLAEGTPRAEVNAMRSAHNYRLYRQDIGAGPSARDVDRYRLQPNSNHYTPLSYEFLVDNYDYLLGTPRGTGEWGRRRRSPIGALWQATNQTGATYFDPYRYDATPYYNDDPYSYRHAQPPELRLRASLDDRAFDDHPDPDALLGETFDDLRARLVRQITERFGMTVDDVWRTWTFDATTHHAMTAVTEGDDTFREWVVEMRAVELPPEADVTGGVWEHWHADTWRFVGSPERGAAPVENVAEMRARARRREISRARDVLINANRARANTLRRRIAERKAQKLLLSCLDETQRGDLDRANGFRVVSQTGELYWVAKGYAGNVYLLDQEGNRVRTFCIHSYGYELPDEDHMLAQKLLLETDEESFLQIANGSSARGSVDLGEAPALREAA